MNFTEYLQEKFDSGLRKDGITYSIYLNPTIKDYEDLASEILANDGYGVRWTADIKKKKFWVHSGNLLHSYSHKHLGIEWKDRPGYFWGKDNLVFGEAEIKSPKDVIFYSSDQLRATAERFANFATAEMAFEIDRKYIDFAIKKFKIENLRWVSKYMKLGYMEKYLNGIQYNAKVAIENYKRITK